MANDRTAAEANEVLEQFERLMDELSRQYLRRARFRPWEIEILVDLASCPVPRSPPRPSGFRAASEVGYESRGSLSIRLLKPQVIGLVFMRMQDDPLAVRRPAQTLIFRRGRIYDSFRLACRQA